MFSPLDQQSTTHVARVNAAVSVSAGAMSCISLWLIAHIAISNDSVPQAYYLPYIFCLMGTVLLWLSPHLPDGDDNPITMFGNYGDDGQRERMQKALVWASCALVCVGPVGSVWVASIVDFDRTGREFIFSGSLLCIAALIFKFSRYHAHA